MGLYDRWIGFRNQCLTSPKFHKFAIRFPLTRPIVRKRQNEVFDIVSGFVYSQILFVLVELELLQNEALREGVTLDEFSKLAGLEHDQSCRLAKGAVALRLLEECAGIFTLGDLGAALSINEGAIAMIKHHKHLYKDLSDPVQFLKNDRQETNLSRYWDYARNLDPASASPEKVAEYSQLMNDSQRDVSDEVLAAFDFSKYKTLMDLGGGQGAFLTNVGASVEHLDLWLFDLPEVVARAEQLQAKSNIPSQITLKGGSFFDGELPKGADLISLIRILHDHDDEPAQMILDAAFNALPPGGALLIAEPMSTGKSAHKISDAYFNFYLYAMGSGRPRSPTEVFQMLKRAGFSSSKQIPTNLPFVASIITAQK